MSQDLIARGIALKNDAQLIDITNRNIFESFDRAADWTVTNGAIENNSIIARHGQSLKVTTATGAVCTVDKGISKYFGVAPKLQFYVYIEDYQTINGIAVFIGSSTDLSKSYSRSLYPQTNGWNLITINPLDWYSNAGELWTNQMITLRIRVTTNSGRVAVVYLDDLRINAEGTPRAIVTFDDARISQYTSAYAYMATKGVKGVIYVPQSRVGSSGYCTEAQLTEMYNAGWDIGNHTKDHLGMNTLTLAQQMSQLTDNRQYLDSLGFTRASRHVAYPGGLFNDDTMTAMRNTGMLTGRTVSTRTQHTDLQVAVNEDLLLSVMYVLNTRTVAQVEGYIDEAVKAGATVILCFHAIVDVSTQDIEYLTADFQSIINYLVAQRIPVVTISEWWNELNQFYFKKV